MPPFEIRPAISNDLPRLMGLDHTCTSDYVWQLELHSEVKQVVVNFHEVRLPRSITVSYPRNPSILMDDWMKRDLMLVVLKGENLVGYACAVEDRTSSIARVTDLVVSTETRRQGGASALLSGIQAWALERSVHRVVLETQSKNYPCIRFAQKFGYEFCGYNDQYYSTQDVALFFGRALK